MFAVVEELNSGYHVHDEERASEDHEDKEDIVFGALSGVVDHVHRIIPVIHSE